MMTELTRVPALSTTLTSARLPRMAPAFVAVGAAALAGLLVLVGRWNFAAAGIVGVLAYISGLYVWSLVVEGDRSAKNRLATCMVWLAFAVVCIPLVWLIWTVIGSGVKDLNIDFLTKEGLKRTEVAGGGILHALLGTLVMTVGAAVIAVPIGVMCAIYLIEYGRGTWLARVITILVDVMTGIPSIVAGLFALSVFLLISGPGNPMAVSASVALSLLMIPTVVRSTEEMLRLVPDDLREAAYALGVTKRRTITKVVLRTSVGGILTGIMLATARVIGETAPILVLMGTAMTKVNTDPFNGLMSSLPTYIYGQFHDGQDVSTDRAWAAALVLILLVMILNLLARLIGKIFAPKTGR